jgi:hypothetical protein
LNIEFFSSTMNDDRIFFKIIMLTLNSNNFHLWIEELKDLALKIKIWKYINSYDKIEESRKEVLSEISHFLVKQSDLASSTVVDDLITDQINQSAQHLSQSRFRKIFSWTVDSATKKLSSECEKVQAKKEASRENHSKNAQNKWSNSCFD